MVARSAPAGHRGARGWIVSAATVVLVIIPGVVPPHPGAGFVWSPDVLALNAVAAAILMGRHQRPLAVLAAVIGVIAVSVPLGLFNPGLVLAAGVAVYTTMLYVTRRRGFVLTALVALAMLAFVFVDGYSGLQNVLTVLLGGALGDAVRTQRDYVASVTERAERAERTRDAVAGQRVAETRLAIARDLHDVVAHQISVINLHAASLPPRYVTDRPTPRNRWLSFAAHRAPRSPRSATSWPPYETPPPRSARSACPNSTMLCVNSPVMEWKSLSTSMVIRTNCRRRSM